MLVILRSNFIFNFKYQNWLSVVWCFHYQWCQMFFPVGHILTVANSFFLLFFFSGINSCASSPCSHLCLLSSSGPLFFSCACPSGWMLSPDNRNCMRGMAAIMRHEKKDLTDCQSHFSVRQKAYFKSLSCCSWNQRLGSF